MTVSLIGMDVGFYNSIGAYPLEARCEMLAELGYTGTNLTLWSEPAWADLPRLARATADSGLEASSVYVTVDIAAPLEDEATRRALALIGSVEATRTVEVALVADSTYAPSDPAGDDRARAFLERALAAAESNEVTLLLYPHTFGWVERIDDAVRLAATFDDPRLGLTFSAFHWYAADRQDLDGTLQRAARYLGMANVSGSRPQSGGYFPATIEPVGGGELDVFHVVATLRENGYTGALGVQGYGIGGDPYEAFASSRDAIGSIEDRLARHPAWRQLRPDRI
ncbi:MAG: Xylose isomerase protein barrel [Frondihabitans sp.]|nr:Xylose isomerase protein barrel [Frondihabitans sp.]